MIFWFIQWSILSFIFIFLLHHLYSFFIDTLTVPKIKDLVNKPQDRYNELFTMIEKNKSIHSNIFPNNETNNHTNNHTNKDIDDLNTDTMHNELIDFLNNIKKNNKNIESTHDIPQDGTLASNSYSIY